MTAFLAVDVLRVHAAPIGVRAAMRRANASRPVGWLDKRYGQPVRRWRIGTKVPELPPG